MIVVAGEALVDLAPRGEHLLPLLGGSPYNVAVGLGRLGRSTTFLGRCSTDGFGSSLRERLTAEGVSTELTATTDDPTTLAVVHLDDRGHASYGFYLDGTSAAGLDATDLPDLGPASAVHVSLGAVTLDTRPAGAALTRLVEREAGHRTVSFDPNVRPAVIGDLRGYAHRLEQLLAHCDLVKVSDEDLAALYPGEPVGEVARRWAAAGPALVVVTRGADGALAVPSDAPALEVGGARVDVVDTVGAGDAFTAGLLAWLDAHGMLHRQAMEALAEEQLRALLEHAARVAAITCTRPGADPPRADELELPAARR